MKKVDRVKIEVIFLLGGNYGYVIFKEVKDIASVILLS